MSYPGNATLSEEIRGRVLTTFGQTLDLATSGKRQEALLGCEFILRLDPLFEPARELQRRIEATEGPAAVDDLRGLLGPQPPAEVDLARELAELLDRRDFHPLLALAEQHQARVAADPGLARIVGEARNRLEAEPYIRTFIDRAARLLTEGKERDAEAELAKARRLDPSHPELVRAAQPATAGPPPVEVATPGDGGDERIERLLGEGQQAFERGDYQAAIDSWSRIFLIDIDHGEANRRIEEARRLKAERERQLEELFHEGVSLFDIGSKSQARRVFERVLAADPHHLAARDYVEQIEDEERAPQGPAPGPAAESSGEEIFVPPDLAAPLPAPAAAAASAGAAAARSARRPPPPPAAAKASRLPRPAFWAIGGAVLLVVLAAGWLLYSRRDGLFPNSADGQAVTGDADLLARAEALRDEGQTASAIQLLRRVPNTHPQHAEAQSLIAQWETLADDSAPAATDLARYERLVADAQAAAAAGENVRTLELLRQAEAIAALDGTAAELLAVSRQRTVAFERELELVRQGDWEFALPELWRIHQADPGNRDVVRLIVDSYFNLAIRDLQRNDVPEAASKLQEGLRLAPEDAGLLRLARFARLYNGRAPDLRYRIFVKYLPFR